MEDKSENILILDDPMEEPTDLQKKTYENFWDLCMDIKNEEQEEIICAAIHYNDGLDYGSQPENIDSGFVVGGRRHDACIGILYGLGYDLSSDYRTEGFITTFNRFVDRHEGAYIAKDAGQAQTDYLFSEDLY